MTALLHRLLHDHPHAGRIQLPTAVRAKPRSPREAPLAATGERLVSSKELDVLRSLHPRRTVAGS